MNLACFEFILNGKQAVTIVTCVYIQLGCHPHARFELNGAIRLTLRDNFWQGCKRYVHGPLATFNIFFYFIEN